MIWAACIVGAYLLGSIPFGLLLGLARGVDVRQHGSQNIGATNVGRVLGRPWGALCFLLDGLKGAVPVLAPGWMHGLLQRESAAIGAAELWLWLAVAAAAVSGHMWSLFLKFRGGKGVATGFGAMVAMWPVLTFPALGALAVWYGVLRVKHYMSLASMMGAASLPLWYLASIVPTGGGDDWQAEMIDRLAAGSPALIVTTLLALAVIYKHRANIGRIRRGEEARVQRP
jgi:glycerol-3-phosphate acyltransferase PlsY